ncbi:MAG: hypothetical protein NXH79_11525 [Rhodobacteraceae bacterium]|nr:hypothetical protein [Paracoccaceae bacterium]
MSGGWDGFLDEGEHVLWQGRPDPGIEWRQMLSPTSLFGVVFTAFSLFWMGAAAAMIWGTGDAPGIFVLFPLFGLPFLLIGLFMMGGNVVWAAYLRRSTIYSVATRQVFIARDTGAGRTLEAIRIANITDIALEGGDPGTVRIDVARPLGFRTEKIDGPDGMGMARSKRSFRLARLPEAARVFSLIRDQQRALAEAAAREGGA